MKKYSLLALPLVFSLGTGMLAGVVVAAPLADRLERPARISSEVANTLFTDLQSVADKVLVAGKDGRVIRLAADGSLVQSQVPVDLLLTAVHFVDANSGWAVGHDGVILHSKDAGQSWSKQLDGRTINHLMMAWAESEIARLEPASKAAPESEALSEELENAYFALDDVKAASEAGPSRPLLDVWFKDVRTGWAVGAYGMILTTEDGGQTWQFVPQLDNPERLHLNSVVGLDDGSLLVAGENGRLYRSSDGGQHWQPAQQLTEASLYKLLPLQGSRLLALGFGGTLLSSQDQGVNWQPITIRSRASLYGGSQLADGSVLLTGQGGLLLYSQDLHHFQLGQMPNKAALLGAAQMGAGQLALIGSSGVKIMTMAELKERLQ